MAPETKKRFSFAVLPVLAGFFVMGFCDIVGITSDYVQRTFGWSDSMTGFVPSMVFIWFLFLGIPVGNLINRWGRKNTVLISMAVTVVGMLLPIIVYDSVTCMVAYAMLGIGNAMLQVSLNPLLGNVVTDSRMLTSSLTAGQVIKAASSLAGPEIVMFAISRFGEDRWYWCFPVLGAITLLSALWLWLTPVRREEKRQEHQSFAATFALLKDSRILLLFLGIFFIVGVDVGVNYISSKLMTVYFDWTPQQAKTAPQIYFFCRTAGALLGAFLLTKVSASKYFRANIAVCIAVMLVLLFTRQETVSAIAIGCVGFLGSSVFSIIYSFALQDKPQYANEISGLMITAVAGGAVVPPVMGFAIDNAGIAGGLAVILVCVLYLAFLAFRLKDTQISD